MNKRFVMAILLLASLAAVFFLTGSMYKPLGRFLIPQTPNGYVTGDLSNYAELADFNELIPLSTEVGIRPSLEDARILVAGDSFSYTNYASPPLHVELEEVSGYESYYLPDALSSTVTYLRQQVYRSGHSNVIVVEMVERNIKSVDWSGERKSDRSGSVAAAYERLKILFNKGGVEYFIKNNILLKPARLWLKRLAYRYFGEMDPTIGAYSRQPKMLFFRDDVDFNADPTVTAPNSVADIADQIEKLGQTLHQEFGLHMIFVVVPNKYSIYHDILKNDPGYNGFIPLLQSQLKIRGVEFVDLYGQYRAVHAADPDFSLYFSNDTHYTAAGKAILANDISEKAKAYLSVN